MSYWSPCSEGKLNGIVLAQVVTAIIASVRIRSLCPYHTIPYHSTTIPPSQNKWKQYLLLTSPLHDVSAGCDDGYKDLGSGSNYESTYDFESETSHHSVSEVISLVLTKYNNFFFFVCAPSISVRKNSVHMYVYVYTYIHIGVHMHVYTCTYTYT